MNTAQSLIFRAAQAFSAEKLRVKGEIPSYVRGDYYLNGPGLFQRGGMTYNHWLDGDAIVRHVRFSDDGIDYTSRYMGSRRHREEEAEGRPIFRNFGTGFDGDLLNESGMGLEANINVSAYPFKNRLLAFGEQALPLELDPATLETLGECTFDGALKAISPFSGHPKYDARKQRLCNFGVQFLGKRSMLYYYEFDEDLQLATKGSTTLHVPASMHDFAISEHYACFFVAPYVLDVRRVAKGNSTLIDALEWDTQHQTVLVVMERASGKLAARIPLDRTSYSLHLINAYEREGQLVVDLVDTSRPFFNQYLREPGMFTDIAPCSTLRIEVDTEDWSRKRIEALAHDIHLDFPTIDRGKLGYAYDNYWVLGMPAAPEPAPKFYDRLLRFSWSTRQMEDSYHASPGYVLSGEPALVKHPTDPQQGMVLCQMHELARDRSAYVLLDAYNLAAGPVAEIALPQADPMGFHSVFQPVGAQWGL